MVSNSRSARASTMLPGSTLWVAAAIASAAVVSPTLVSPALAAPAAAVQGSSGPRDSFLLIDGGAPSGQARLTGCDQAISNLHASLDQIGAQNTVLIAPSASATRDALLRFGASAPGTPHALLFCGYAAETGGNVFALGSDFASHDDPALDAVSTRAFSRVVGDKGGLVMLDLHPMVVDGAPASAAAGALQGAAEAWSGDATLGGTKLAVTDRQPGEARLIAEAARSGSGTTDGIARSVASQDAAPLKADAPAATVATAPEPAPATSIPPTQTTPTPKTPAQTIPAPVDSPPPASPAAQAPVADTHPAKDAADAAIPLAPKPTGGSDTGSGSMTGTGSGAGAGADSGAATPIAPPPPPRPKVHVDPAVRRVQVALLARGLFSGRVNGVNTTDTQSGIKHFQAMLGHPVTGQLTADETKELTGG